MTIEELKNEVAAGLKMRDFQGNLITDWETFHSIYGIHQNTLELLMKRWAQEENYRLLEEKAKLINTVTRRGIFFIENKETRRWVLAKYCADFEGDFQTRDPHKAQRFETILEALMTMKNEGFKMSDWEITEHIFCDPS